jgi:serine/threonine-protein kinase
MEYIQGESLASLIKLVNARGDKIPVRVVSAIMSGVLYGLHAAHEATDERGQPLRMVHRDISPQNVLVGTDGVARVVDFGIAKAVGRLQTTSSGQLKGKLSYMAPEQLHAEELDRRADIYAAGVVLWEAVTGERLFRGDNEPDTIRRVLAGRVPPPSTLAPDVPPLLDALVQRAVSQAPRDRFSTAREMSASLMAACPPAAPHEVGEWVEGYAHESLTRRAARIADLESGLVFSKKSATIRGVSTESEDTKAREQVSHVGVAVSSVSAGPSRVRWAVLAVAAAAALAVGAFLLGARNESSRFAAAPPASASESAAGIGSASVTEIVRQPTSIAPTPSGSAVGAPSASAAPPPTAPSRPRKDPAGHSPGAVDCNPPYTRGADGHKIWKRECFASSE